MDFLWQAWQPGALLLDAHNVTDFPGRGAGSMRTPVYHEEVPHTIFMTASKDIW